MKTLVLTGTLIALALSLQALGADTLSSHFEKNGTNGQVRVHSQLSLPISSMAAEYTIFRSTNMSTWEPVAGPFLGGVGVSDETLRQAVPLAGNSAFYRVVAEVKLVEDSSLGSSIYGYGTEFSKRLQQIGQIPLEEFVLRYPAPDDYLGQLTFAPTSAEYWTNFAANPKFQLSPDELAIFETNAFVVSQRLGSYSFARSFYDIFTADMPVYFSCDAALHAWHRSYLNLLEELEESYLFSRLESVLADMQNQVNPLWTQAQGKALSNGVLDADYFIAVARSLLSGSQQYGSLGQNNRVQATLNEINNLQPDVYFNLFGATRRIDFTQFQVRGHYETSQRLGRYFKAMMWCGLTDFRFTGRTNDNSLRELSGAIAMHLLLKNSNRFADWKQMDDVIEMFVGPPDSLNFAQFGDLLTSAGISSPADVATTAALETVRDRIMSGNIGVQNIQGALLFSPLSPAQLKLPRSFAVMPRRFTLDAWALNQCVFDRIFWDENGIPEFTDKVMRRVPSALDVAFSVLRNDHVTPLIAARIANSEGHPWRDGYPYQHNLSAVRDVVDAQTGSSWTNNIYHCWLACLRELSHSTTAPNYPDAMRKKEWAMKSLNTQLASYTELKHDTVLYAKQPYTANVTCSYPSAFVEPRIDFWMRMREMAVRTERLLSTLPRTGSLTFEPNAPGAETITVSNQQLYEARTNFLHHFVACMEHLRQISGRQLYRLPLTTEQDYFLQSLTENPAGYSGAITYSGWYHKLFYANVRARYSGMLSVSDLWDPMVTDVHTDPTDDIVHDPGSILHQGVGNAALLMVSVNWGPGDACVYAGPVLTHYEFETPTSIRKTDSQWKAEVKAGTLPPLPEWTRSWQVPGNIPFYPNPY